MPPPTPQELLDAANAAMLVLLQTGQRVRVGDREYEGHSIADLRAYIDGLAGVTGTGLTRLAAFRKGA